jgi:hypothetical protein
VTLSETEQAFFFNVLAQLPPDMRSVFTRAWSSSSDPPGSIDRALRAALVGL